MAVENLPLWTLLPNWAETVSESLTWVSGVLASPSGAEQRFALRTTPRRSLEASFLLFGQDRAWADNALVSALGVPWYVPLFYDMGRITSDTTPGSDEIVLDTTNREFSVGGFVMLRSGVFSASVHQIDEILPDRLVVTPGVGAFPAGTLVMPCAPMRLDGGAASVARLADRAGRLRLRFVQDGGASFPETFLPPSYRDFPVMNTPPNESNDLTTEYSRIQSEIRNTLTKPFIVDTAGKNFSVQQHTWLVSGKADQDALRGFFYALEGRRNALWIPTFAADLDLVATVSAFSTNIVVKRCGYTAFGGPRFGREDIRIELYDGTFLIRRITASAESGDTETLTLSAALGVTVEPRSVKRISFMHLCRLDQDSVELVHYADKAGALTVRAGFKTCGDLRTGGLIFPMPFTQGIITPEWCGGPPPPPPEPVPLGSFLLYGNWMFPQFTAAERVVGWNAYTVDDNNASGMPGGASGASSLVAPPETILLRVSGRVVMQQSNGNRGGEYVAVIERRASEGEPWITLSATSVLLGPCSSTVCGPFTLDVPEETVSVLPGWQVRMRLLQPQTVFLRYDNNPSLTFIEGTWFGEG